MTVLPVVSSAADAMRAARAAGVGVRGYWTFVSESSKRMCLAKKRLPELMKPPKYAAGVDWFWGEPSDEIVSGSLREDSMSTWGGGGGVDGRGGGAGFLRGWRLASGGVE